MVSEFRIVKSVKEETDVNEYLREKGFGLVMQEENDDGDPFDGDDFGDVVKCRDKSGMPKFQLNKLNRGKLRDQRKGDKRRQEKIQKRQNRGG